MSDHIWETFDALFKTAQMQARRIEDMETRITELERQLRERSADVIPFPASDEREVMEV
jgi:hypothetical protein